MEPRINLFLQYAKQVFAKKERYYSYNLDYKKHTEHTVQLLVTNGDCDYEDD